MSPITSTSGDCSARKIAIASSEQHKISCFKPKIMATFHNSIQQTILQQSFRSNLCQGQCRLWSSCVPPLIQSTNLTSFSPGIESSPAIYVYHLNMCQFNIKFAAESRDLRFCLDFGNWISPPLRMSCPIFHRSKLSHFLFSGEQK